MAGDWIVWTKGLSSKREVLAIAASTGRDRRQVACLLMEFWEWADGETDDGLLRALSVHILCTSRADTDAQFWNAVIDSGWLVVEGGGLRIPHFDYWMGQSSKRRLKNAKRMRQERSPAGRAQNVHFKVHKPCTREEKSREEKNTKTPLFVPPSLDEVAAYCRERNNGIDPEVFIAHYESKGWLIGKTPMKSWKAAVITFEKNAHKFNSTGKGKDVDLFSGVRGFAARTAALESSNGEESP